jgi:streptomycin 6-kinase
LHGDLHHFNVLRAGSGWLAIDPQGMAGEPSFDLAAFLLNPHRWFSQRPEASALIRRRAVMLSEAFGFPGERIVGWAWLLAVLSAVWSVEDGADPAYALACAALLNGLA